MQAPDELRHVVHLFHAHGDACEAHGGLARDALDGVLRGERRTAGHVKGGAPLGGRPVGAQPVERLRVRGARGVVGCKGTDGLIHHILG